MNFSATVHSVWTCVGLLTEWFLLFSTVLLHCSLILAHFMLFAGSLLHIALTRGHVGLKLPFGALAGGASRLYLSLPALPCGLLFSLTVSFFYLSPLWGFPHSSLWWFSHEFFSLLYIRLLPRHHSPLTSSLLLFLSLACLIDCFINLWVSKLILDIGNSSWQNNSTTKYLKQEIQSLEKLKSNSIWRFCLNNDLNDSALALTVLKPAKVRDYQLGHGYHTASGLFFCDFFLFTNFESHPSSGVPVCLHVLTVKL